MINNLIFKSLIYGGIDGIITIFNVISSIEGAQLNIKYIFIIGIAVLIADGLSMGMGDYLSIKAQKKINSKNKVEEKKNIIPINNGIVTFVSFLIFGSIPLILYNLLINVKNNKFIKLYLLTLSSLFTLGIVQSKYTNDKWYISGLNTSFFGGITAILSYSISKYFSKIFN